MKRKSVVPKLIKANPKRGKFIQSECTSGTSSGGDMSPPPPDDNMEQGEPYACPTSNRFAILAIEKPPLSVLKIRKTVPKAPPPIFVPEIRSKVDKLLKNFNFNDYVLENVREGTNIHVNTTAQHKSLLDSLLEDNIQYSSRPPPGVNYKRFVVFGLNSSDEENIIPDLASYGITAAKTRIIKVKRPRYDDHCNFVVYINQSENISLNIISQAQYISKSKVRWADFIVNGDGTSKCSRCQRFGHPGDYCNLPPRCGVCAGYHLTLNCELIAMKRANQMTSIDSQLLCCVHCQGKHTAGFSGCPKRPNFTQKGKKQQQPFVDAPLPNRNHWKQPSSPRAPLITQSSPAGLTHNRTTPSSNNQRQQQVHPNYTNNSFQNPQPSAEPDNQTKFTAKQIASIFAHVINCVEKCKTKAEQLQTIISVIAEYYP